MVVQEIAIDKLSQFIEEYKGDKCSLELLLFLGKHPYTWFGRLAIVHALDARRLDIERALGRLIERGLVKIHTDNGTSFYSLIDDESLCSSVLDLVKTDCGQRQRILKQFYPTPK